MNSSDSCSGINYALASVIAKNRKIEIFMKRVGGCIDVATVNNCRRCCHQAAAAMLPLAVAELAMLLHC